MNSFYISQNIARIIILLLALILHEIAHAVVALWNGDSTAKDMGRISLNPVKHFDLLGLIMLLTLRFGYGRPVPINAYNFKRRRLGYFTVSIAGVTVNFLLSFIFMGIYIPLYSYTNLFSNVLYTSNFFVQLLFNFLQLGIYINIFLMVFNLLPIYPLDGFRVIESFTKYNNPYTVFMRKYGQYIILGLFLITILGSYLFPSLLIQYPYLNPLGLVIETVSDWIITPIFKLWKLIWGVR